MTRKSPVDVVESARLAPYIQQWIDGGSTLLSLSRVAGVGEKTLRQILSGQLPTVRELTADRILSGLGLPHVFNEIVPDPPISKYWED
jgi:hypothetical protein